MDQMSICKKISFEIMWERLTDKDTDIKQDRAILLLIHNMSIQNLVIQGLGFPVSTRHEGRSRTTGSMGKLGKKVAGWKEQGVSKEGLGV